MTIYDDLQGVASEILTEFDQEEIKLVQYVKGTGPADNPGASIPTTHTLDGVARGVSFKYVQSGFAVASDKQVTVAVIPGVIPTENDFVDIDGIRHKIIKDVSVPAAGTRCVWKFLVRKG
jgi:hypothetical protein